jgi:hypothetical protein
MMKNDVVTTRKKNKRDGMMDLQNQITFGEQNRMQNCMSDILKKMSYPSKWQCRVHKTMPQQTSKHVSTKICQGKNVLIL